VIDPSTVREKGINIAASQEKFSGMNSETNNVSVVSSGSLRPVGILVWIRLGEREFVGEFVGVLVGRLVGFFVGVSVFCPI